MASGRRPVCPITHEFGYEIRPDAEPVLDLPAEHVLSDAPSRPLRRGFA